MSISEEDISILIPTYRYRDKVGRAVDSALASGAGEVIVTDDCSGDGTLETLAQFSDPRLRIYENEKNLGLWENHLRALGYATRPWIKFIQADDYLLPMGLTAYAAAVEPGVHVIWACPLVKDEKTGDSRQLHKVTKIHRLKGVDLLDTCLKVGWLLGTPSEMMLHADAIERDPAAWITELSSDLVIGSIAAVHGDVVLLPPGPISQCVHPRQDAKMEGRLLGLRRMVASADYLRARSEPALQRFATLWSAVNQPVAQRTAVSGVLRRQIPPAEALRLVFHYRTLAKARRRSPGDRALLQAAHAFRRSSRSPHDIDSILAAHYTRSTKSGN